MRSVFVYLFVFLLLTMLVDETTASRKNRRRLQKNGDLHSVLKTGGNHARVPNSHEKAMLSHTVKLQELSKMEAKTNALHHSTKVRSTTNTGNAVKNTEAFQIKKHDTKARVEPMSTLFSKK
jgi:predicted Holliday junction resolvase-like endonuclease